tara:strand:- start:3918 stop:5048 length:1131 start_codon:yes stop_codon:yes gene_type:complete
MFGKLKEKFSSWIKSDKKETKKPSPTKPKDKKKKSTNKTVPQKTAVQLEKQQPEVKITKPSSNALGREGGIESQVQEDPIKEEEPQGFFSKLKKKIIEHNLKEEEFEEIFQDLEITLLENNVALETVDKIKESLSKDLVGKSIKSSEADEKILSSLKQSIEDVLIEPPDLIKQIKDSKEPYVILFFGINGSGKTTSVAKLAHLLKKEKLSCVLAAGDTFRAASIEQLSEHASKLSVPIIKHEYGHDPASVAFDAIQYAKKNNIKAILIDTAGRMYTASNLLKEMEKIVRVSKPNLKIFVGESITGNDATSQAKTFNESIGLDGIILSKADIDEKAGTILSVSHVTQKPIYFLGTGQEYKDLTPFKKSLVLKNLGLD